MVMNDPRRAYHETYEVEYDRHSYDGHNWKYLNLPMEEIAQLAIASLKDGHKMYSSYDVGKQLDRKRGYMDVDNYDYGSLLGTLAPMPLKASGEPITTISFPLGEKAALAMNPSSQTSVSAFRVRTSRQKIENKVVGRCVSRVRVVMKSTLEPSLLMSKSDTS